MNATAEDNTRDAETASADAARGAADASFAQVFGTGARFVVALRRAATTLLALLVAEARVACASLAVVFLCVVALVAFSVSLWACVVALVGWALMLATGSIGIALAILVGMHLALVVLLWFAIKRAVHHASFPLARAEFRVLERTVRRNARRFQRASPRRDPEASP